MKIKQIILASVLLFLSSLCFASTIGYVECECPICNERFSYQAQFSYYLSGKNLDLKPFGAAIIPNPIPKCEKCGFVFDYELFTDEEIQKLKTLILNNQIPDLDKNYPNYYYLAQEMLLLEKSKEDIACIFLESVWENKNMENNEFLLKNALKYLESVSRTSNAYTTYLLIRVDLERRLSNFDNALALIEEIKGIEDFYKEYIVEIVEYQEKLISEKDIDEHPLP